MDKRQQILSEFVESERHYVRDLTTVLEVWLSDENEHLSHESRVLLRSNLPAILASHENVLRAMINTTRQDHDDLAPYHPKYGNKSRAVDMNNVPGVLIRFAPEFSQLYEEYVVGYENVIVHFETLRTEKRVREVWDRQRRIPRCHGLDMAGFLIMPIQRLPRYELLLGDLSKQKCTSDELALLPEALNELHTITLNVNDRKREIEYEDRLKELDLYDVVSTPDVYSGFVWVWSSISKHKTCVKLQEVHVFDELLVWATTTRVKGRVDLLKCRVSLCDIPDVVNTLDSKALANFANGDVPTSLNVRADDDTTTKSIKELEKLRTQKLSDLRKAVCIKGTEHTIDHPVELMLCFASVSAAQSWYGMICEAARSPADHSMLAGMHPYVVKLGRKRQKRCEVVLVGTTRLQLRSCGAVIDEIQLNDVVSLTSAERPFPNSIVFESRRRPLTLVAPSVRVRKAWLSALSSKIGGLPKKEKKRCIIS